MAVSKTRLFWEIHSDLPREGPGDNVSTRMAFSMCEGLPRAPRVLDIACGPGMQTLELARLTDGDITAIDTHKPFLDELRRRARAAGVEGRITPAEAAAFWTEYPGMGTVADASAIIARAGYAEVGHFTLPDASWWDDYYTPKEARLAMLEAKYAASPADLTALAEARRELDVHRRYSDYYGYVFFVARKAG